MKSYSFISALLLILLSSCIHADSNEKNDESNLLFRKSVQLLNTYIDSIENCTDSLTLQNLRRNFDNKITSLNFEFPPDTDLDMSEEENDSLIVLYKKMKSSILHRDSVIMRKIPLDSLSSNLVKDTLNDTK